MLGQGEDLVPALVDDVVQATQGHDVASGSTAQDALQADLHGSAVGSVEDLAQLLLDLVGPGQSPVVGECRLDGGFVRVGGALPGAQ